MKGRAACCARIFMMASAEAAQQPIHHCSQNVYMNADFLYESTPIGGSFLPEIGRLALDETHPRTSRDRRQHDLSRVIKRDRRSEAGMAAPKTELTRHRPAPAVAALADLGRQSRSGTRGDPLGGKNRQRTVRDSSKPVGSAWSCPSIVGSFPGASVLSETPGC